MNTLAGVVRRVEDGLHCMTDFTVGVHALFRHALFRQALFRHTLFRHLDQSRQLKESGQLLWANT